MSEKAPEELRLAYLCGEYPRATDGFIQREVATLRGDGIHVRTISVRRPPTRERALGPAQNEAESTLYLLPASPWRLLVAHGRSLFSSPLRYVRSLALALVVRPPGLRAIVYQCFYFAEAGLVAEIMRRERLQHLHNHAPDASGFVAMIAAEMAGFTYSMTLHGFGILSEPTRWRLREKIERALFTICISWQARSQAMISCDTDVWSRLHVVHCGVEPGPDPRPASATSGSGARLIFVGRLDPVKGLPILLEAFARLVATRPDSRLDIVGDGPQREELESSVARDGLGDRVTFHGYLEPSAVRDLLVRADVFVMSSLSEGIPVVLMEAMIAGVPVVAPRITGIPELVQDERTGLLFTPGNPAEMAQAMLRLLSDTALRQTLVAQGWEFVAEEFNLTRETQRLEAVIRARLSGAEAPIRPAAAAPERSRKT
ncbi:glycosyltransferase family 4 protein [Thioalkalivibrio sp. XN279]|uniref:glycosyltransferase family 4 protein n=1 Tax=Thioalkalivibrio sp. XN279 TaxID=2714953 RepID=UPI0019825F5C